MRTWRVNLGTILILAAVWAVLDFFEGSRRRSGAPWTEATTRSRNGEFDLALKAFDEAVRLAPKHVPLYLSRARTFMHMGEYDRAIADLDTAIRIHPDSLQAYTDRGSMRGLKGDVDGAIADYSEAIRIEHNDPLAFSNRARAYWKKGEMALAIADFEAALALRPYFEEARRDLVAAKAAAGIR